MILVDWYLPGYKAGGPVQSCANMVSHLKDRYRFSIVCRDTDYGETGPYPGIPSDTWIETEKGVRIYYISKGNRTNFTLKKLLKGDYTVLYLNSLFSYYFSILPLILNKSINKVILAPRGMLGQGALSIKPLKKKLFLTGAKCTGFFSKITWHASTNMEASEIKAAFGQQAKVITALNLPPVKSLTQANHEKKPNSLCLFFLSRISPKKNLLAALNFLEQVNPCYSIKFNIIGPAEDLNYWKRCQEKIADLKERRPSLTISYEGPIENKRLNEKLKEFHGLILPTLNENFGHVILDALAAGCPVILSDQTPWKNLQERKIGWDFPLSNEKDFVAAIETLAAMNQESFNELSLNAFKEAVKFYNDQEIISQNIMLFE